MMALFKRKPDPISDRARALAEEIAVLEAQIRKLDARLQQERAEPHLPSATSPNGEQDLRSLPPSPPVHEPVFEEVQALESVQEPASRPEHYNQLGVRKYDLTALVSRIRNQFRGPTTTNPKLVSYLAAGGIQGLRPLRYEKRVARNRFIFFVAFLFLVLLGLVLVFVKQR